MKKKIKKITKIYRALYNAQKTSKNFFLLKQKNQCFCYILTLKASLRHINSKKY